QGPGRARHDGYNARSVQRGGRCHGGCDWL
ncbi:MAG: hypothetical protein AVDCRST_MAG88-4285, partial [uncultured Thermomicrobiales bacterium]